MTGQKKVALVAQVQGTYRLAAAVAAIRVPKAT